MTVRLEVHPAFLPASHTNSRDIEYRARIADVLKAGPLSLAELSRAMGYKSIPKRLSDAIASMAREGTVAKVATGGVRTKIALIVHS